MKTTLILSLVVIGVGASAIVACSGDSEDAMATAPKNVWEGGTSSATEQFEGGCNTNGIIIKGGAGPGAACERASDCNAVCCKCGATPKTWAAASCVSGVCSDEPTVCAATKDDVAFCSP